MTHREQIIAMLEDAGLDFGYSQGDTIITSRCRFRFFGNGRLRDVESEEDEHDESY